MIPRESREKEIEIINVHQKFFVTTYHHLDHMVNRQPFQKSPCEVRTNEIFYPYHKPFSFFFIIIINNKIINKS